MQLLERKTDKRWRYFLMLLGLNGLFFFFYHFALGLNLSWPFFIICILLCAAALIFLDGLNKFAHPRLSYFILLIFNLFFAIYLYVNFLYFKVFDKFLEISFRRLAFVNSEETQLLSSYLKEAPWWIIGLIIVFCFGSWLIASKYVKSNFARQPQTVMQTLSLIVIATATLGFIQFYKTSFLVSDFSVNKYYAALSVYGDWLNFDFQNTQPPQDIIAAASGASPIEIFSEQLKKLKTPINSSAEKILINRPASTPNIIFYQVESLDNWALDVEPSAMPFLKSLMAENITADNFYANGCDTVDAEFSSLCSFFPDSAGPISDLYSNNQFYCLPSVLKDRYDYRTYAYHANAASFWNRQTLYPSWGIDNLNFTPTYPLRTPDNTLLNAVVENIKVSQTPTFNYVVGFTSHGPHNQEFMDFNYYNFNLKIKKYSGDLGDLESRTKESTETLRAYLGFLTQTDDFIKELFDRLKTENLLDDTIVVIYGDHKYYGFNRGDELQNFYTQNKIPLLIYTPDKLKYRASTASFMDVAPTILNLIEGNNYSAVKNFQGESFFEENRANFAVNKCLKDVFYADDQTVAVGRDFFNYSKFLLKSSDKNSGALIDSLKTVTRKSDDLLRQNALISKNDDGLTLEINLINDIDKDGLTDVREKNLGTDYLNKDSDGDGRLDGLEIKAGCDPLNTDLACKVDHLTVKSRGVLLPSLHEKGLQIARGLGQVNGVATTNSLAALNNKYDHGLRFFEIDLMQTTDDQLILSADEKLLGKTFSQIKKITPPEAPILTFEEFLFELKQYPDAYVILNIKDNYRNVIEKVTALGSHYQDVYPRLIPQVYELKDIEFLYNSYAFNDLIYSSYKNPPATTEEFIEIAQNYGVTAIAVPFDEKYLSLKSELDKLNVNFFVHTVNDPTEVEKLLNLGIGVFSDLDIEI